MLILTRAVHEAIMIGNDVRMTVLGVKGRQVRLGFEAPRNLPIHREEVFVRIVEEGGFEASARDEQMRRDEY